MVENIPPFFDNETKIKTGDKDQIMKGMLWLVV
jgi:hypothetical protein